MRIFENNVITQKGCFTRQKIFLPEHRPKNRYNFMAVIVQISHFLSYEVILAYERNDSIPGP